MSFLKGKRFAIVGGNGFVGNRIAAKLIQHSAEVSAISRLLLPYLEAALDSIIRKTKRLNGSKPISCSLNN